MNACMWKVLVRAWKECEFMHIKTLVHAWKMCSREGNVPKAGSRRVYVIARIYSWVCIRAYACAYVCSIATLEVCLCKYGPYFLYVWVHRPCMHRIDPDCTHAPHNFVSVLHNSYVYMSLYMFMYVHTYGKCRSKILHTCSRMYACMYACMHVCMYAPGLNPLAPHTRARTHIYIHPILIATK
jgi:hypothetical protein